MLEAVPHHMGHKMPVDFATYLLASSPPASNFELLSYAFSPEAARNWQRQQAENELKKSQPQEEQKEQMETSTTNVPKRIRKGKLIKPIIIKNASDSEFSDSASNSGYVTPTSPSSPGRSNKKVSFADHKGLALATVKIMTEGSDQPPRFGADVLKSITKGAEAEVTGVPPLKLMFSQPASDYMAFRSRIENNCVALENVILRDYNVLGTVKVKNICYDKQVFVRLTFDSWETTQEIEGKFVPPVGASHAQDIDTFSFEFDIATNVEPTKKVQFAVCYKTPESEFWDNNQGENYTIVATDFNKLQPHHELPVPQSTPSLPHISSWSEYNCWHHVDTSTPYY